MQQLALHCRNRGTFNAVDLGRPGAVHTQRLHLASGCTLDQSFTKEGFMAQGKQITNESPIGSIEQAVRDSDFTKARYSMSVKLARMMDATDSARDVKSLSLTLLDLLEKCETDRLREAEKNDTPLASILAEAETVMANA